MKARAGQLVHRASERLFARTLRFPVDGRGNVLVIFALVFPALGVGVAGAVELAEVYWTKAQLQNIVDNAALSGANQLGSGQSSSTAERVQQYADGQTSPIRARWSVTTSAVADTQSGTFTVTQQAVRPSFFGSLLPPGGFHLTVTATARANSPMPLCVLGSGSKGDVILLQNASTLTGQGCLVQSNGDLTAKDSTAVTAGAVRTTGAASGMIAPAALTDAPPIADPFASLDISVPNGCKAQNLELASGTTSLNPGVHCGNVKLTYSAQLILNPGEHYFTKGGFDVQDSAQITGTDVVLIFKGQYNMHFKDSSGLWLEGRSSGPYAGFTLITDRSFGGDFKISTDNARRLHGTIYLPNATLHVSGSNNKVADQSPWTVLVAKQVKVDGSAKLVINTGYASSSVPVPSGVGPNGGRLIN